MGIWDAVAGGLAGTDTNTGYEGAPLINNSYNCYVGSVLAFYIGKGRVTSIFGGETKLVFDWEAVFLKLMEDRPLPGTTTWIPINARSRKAMGGGDTTLVLGPTNKLNYYGGDAAINRARDDFAMVWNQTGTRPGIGKKTADVVKSESIPLVVWAILLLGFLGIFATAMILRYLWRFSTVPSAGETKQEMLASVLIPMFEGLWISLLLTVELVEGGISGTGGVVNTLYCSLWGRAPLPVAAMPLPLVAVAPPPAPLPDYAAIEAGVAAAAAALVLASVQITNVIESAAAQDLTLTQLKTEVTDLGNEVKANFNIATRHIENIYDELLANDEPE